MFEDQARWKPEAARWSLLEVMSHLHDEEWEDFRPRVIGSLTVPGFMPQPLGDPEQRAVHRNYNGNKLEQVTANFLQERDRSIDSLNSLSEPDWSRGFTIKGIGTLTAENILITWLVHDLVHFRQMLTLEWDYLKDMAKPYSLDYAGSI